MHTRVRPGAAEAAWILAALLALAVGWDASGLDLAFARLAGTASGFPLHDDWLFSRALHEGGRLAAWLFATALCLAVWWPLGPLARLSQARRVQLAATPLLAALAVSLWRLASGSSCPWELADFGGIAHYASHWSLRPDGGSGHCFPATHAVAGFSFTGGYFAWRPQSPRAARLWLAGAWMAGILLGLAQQWRGANFMSGTLWSAVICWGVACAVDALWPRGWRAEGI